MENANKHKYNMLFSIANYNICEEQKFPFKKFGSNQRVYGVTYFSK